MFRVCLFFANSGRSRTQRKLNPRKIPDRGIYTDTNSSHGNFDVMANVSAKQNCLRKTSKNVSDGATHYRTILCYAIVYKITLSCWHIIHARPIPHLYGTVQG